MVTMLNINYQWQVLHGLKDFPGCPIYFANQAAGQCNKSEVVRLIQVLILQELVRKIM